MVVGGGGGGGGGQTDGKVGGTEGGPPNPGRPVGTFCVQSPGMERESGRERG